MTIVKVAAAYAADAAAGTAAYAYATAAGTDAVNRLIALLEGAFAEHARLTGRDALPTLTEDDARRLAAS